MDADNIKTEVQKHYAAIARGAGSCCGSASGADSCCSSDSSSGSTLIRYQDVGLAAEPGAELGLGCGFPTLSAIRR
jgi:hypothetical protein